MNNDYDYDYYYNSNTNFFPYIRRNRPNPPINPDEQPINPRDQSPPNQSILPITKIHETKIHNKYPIGNTYQNAPKNGGRKTNRRKTNRRKTNRRKTNRRKTKYTNCRRRRRR